MTDKDSGLKDPANAIAYCAGITVGKLLFAGALTLLYIYRRWISTDAFVLSLIYLVVGSLSGSVIVFYRLTGRINVSPSRGLKLWGILIFFVLLSWLTSYFLLLPTEFRPDVILVMVISFWTLKTLVEEVFGIIEEDR